MQRAANLPTKMIQLNLEELENGEGNQEVIRQYQLEVDEA